MGSIGPVEILVVLVVALLVLGPQKLPEAARSVGRAIGEVRRYTTGFQDEMRDAFAEPKPTTRPPPATAAETPVPTSEPAAAISGTATQPELTEPEFTEIVAPGEGSPVTEDLPTITGNGDTPSA